jgi:hypothetical protein
MAGAGTQTAGLGFGGNPGPPPNNTGATEEYDGSTWTTSPGSLGHSKYALSRSWYTKQQD